MINLKKKIKKKIKKKKSDTYNDKNKISSKRVSASHMRLCSDIGNFCFDDNIKITFPDTNNIHNINAQITPITGIWKNAIYNFKIIIPKTYPFDPPKCKLLEKIYHPNIDFQGNICLNILKFEWNPVLELSTIIFGFLHLFYNPNQNDPLNKIAGNHYNNDYNDYCKKVKKTLKGESIHVNKEIIGGFKKLI